MSDLDNQANNLRDKMKAATDALIEHCDSVAIVCTIREDGGTITIDSSQGNAFAVDGSLRYLLRRREYLDKCGWRKVDEENNS